MTRKLTFEDVWSFVFLGAVTMLVFGVMAAAFIQ